MPTTRKSSKSPARSKLPRSDSPEVKPRSRKPAISDSPKVKRRSYTTRSRSRSRGRKPDPGSPTGILEANVILRKLPAQIEQTNHSSLAVFKDGRATHQTISSTVSSSVTVLATSSSLDVQDWATPVKRSSRIASLVQKEKEESLRLREQMKLDMLSNIQTPPSNKVDKTSHPSCDSINVYKSLASLLIITLLPAVLIFVNISVSKTNFGWTLSNVINYVLSLFTLEATLIFLAWLGFQALLAVLPVGYVAEGKPLESGGHVKYRCNGMHAFIITFLLLGAAVCLGCPVVKVLDKLDQLMVVSIVFSYLLSVLFYIRSRFVKEGQLAPGGNTGYILSDFCMGRELNPGIGPLDFKLFLELRPGMIGWIVLDWLMVIKAYQDSTSLPFTLVLLSVFHTVYVVDAFVFEDGFSTTFEIADDGLGFILTFGGLAWLPFIATLQGRFILLQAYSLPWYCLVSTTIINFIGFAIYRLPQLEKYRFRKQPEHKSVSGLETLPTPTNKALLVSGWWGVCRKPMYLGDILMALTWSLMTGFQNIATYAYLFYLLVFLLIRERRDDDKCRKRYGASWDQYCQRVRYRIVPYLY